MSEKFLKEPDLQEKPDESHPGRLMLELASSPREVVVAIRHLALIREDLRTGKSFTRSLARVYPQNAPDPKTLYEWAMNNGREDLAFRLWTHFQVLKELNLQNDKALTEIIGEGLEKFFTSEPSAEEIRLLKTMIPEISEQVAAIA
ncbi:MAG: hypothetical protein OEZ23_06025 [Gammaproteobacteria bacterium]|nr:hypothetical protein [Gammaproteobacteria bacterium]